ncbi:hypothetical protein BDF22DRAFT_686465 [Syncephalis plumigaleata]|nr:hypothetical protein BDF22DRAFT_686465 [Syncephalis plumigaleata]
MPKRNAWKVNLNKPPGTNGGGYSGHRSQGGAAGGEMIHCFGCNTEKTRNHFNPTQLAKLAQKKRPPLCLQCSGGGGGGGSSSRSGPRSSSGTSDDRHGPASSSASNASVKSSRSSQGMVRGMVNNNPIPVRTCSYCSETKPKTAYNSTQWKKGEYATCQECMNKFEEDADMDHIHDLTSEKFTYDPDVDIATLPHAAQIAHANKRSLRRVQLNNSMTTDTSANTSATTIVAEPTTMTTTTNNHKGSREKTPFESMDKVAIKASNYDNDFAQGDDFKDYGVFGYGDDDMFYYSTTGSDYTTDYQSTMDSSFTSKYDSHGSSRTSNTYQGRDNMSISSHRSKHSQLIDDGFDDYR